ncbi:MAG TPA: hypothetical protein EYG69_04680 [Campylobacterales bacterium]|nr:hypothetical protein [Campylobacterales bacterium]
MAVGALSTLGLGSSGVLTNDIIDKLKAADKSSLVTPIEAKITAQQAKQTSLADIKTLMTSLSTAVTDMTYEAPYDTLKTKVSGDSVSVVSTIDASAQNFSIDVEQLATKDIHQSDANYNDKTSLFGDGSDIVINGKTISLSITDSIEDVVKKINETAGLGVEASILNVGGTDPYKIVLKSSESGADSQFSVSGFSRVGDVAQDAVFKVDGISIARSSNEIDDLIDGVTISLKKVGISEVNLEKDDTGIIEGIEKFVEKFNEAITKIGELTKFDKATKSSGVFQGNADIRNISRELRDVLTTTISTNSKMFSDFGLEMERDGTLKLNKSELTSAISNNRAEVVEFFKASDASSGLFNRLESKIFDLSTSSSGPLKSLKTSFADTLKRLEASHVKAQEKLDIRYEILRKQFAAADAVMGRLSSESTMLTDMIEAQYAKN